MISEINISEHLPILRFWSSWLSSLCLRYFCSYCPISLLSQIPSKLSNCHGSLRCWEMFRFFSSTNGNSYWGFWSVWDFSEEFFSLRNQERNTGSPSCLVSRWSVRWQRSFIWSDGVGIWNYYSILDLAISRHSNYLEIFSIFLSIRSWSNASSLISLNEILSIPVSKMKPIWSLLM